MACRLGLTCSSPLSATSDAHVQGFPGARGRSRSRSSRGRRPVGRHFSCGLPETQPTWIDFADSSVSFWRERFARPGVVVATGGAGARRRGARGRSRDRALGHVSAQARRHAVRPGRPGADGEARRRALRLRGLGLRLRDAADRAERAVGRVAPDAAHADRRALPGERPPLRHRLAERGGRPALLVSSEPFTGGDAAAWWRSVAAVSDLVLENYANANLIWRDGAVDGSRRLRERYRQSVAKLLAVGIPPTRIGIMIGFQTGAGSGRTRGAEAALALVRRREVAGARRPSGRAGAEARARLVVGLGAARRALERSRTRRTPRASGSGLATRACATRRASSDASSTRTSQTGQLNLPAGTRCVYGTTPLTASSVAALAKVTHDRELALTALVVRAIERERARVSPSEALALERRIVRRRFGGSAARVPGGAVRMRARARRSRAASSATSCAAREHRGSARGRSRSRRPTSRASARPSRPCVARELVVSPAPSWLPGRARRRARRRPPRGRVPRADGAAHDDPHRRRRRSRSSHSTTRPPSLRSPPRSRGPRSCASSAPSAARTRTRRGRSACRRPPRASSSASETDCPSSASSTARRTRRSSRSREPEAATLARGSRRRLGALGDVARRPLRGRHDHVATRALREPERGVGADDECRRVVVREQLGDAAGERDDADLRERPLAERGLKLLEEPLRRRGCRPARGATPKRPPPIRHGRSRGPATS